LVVLLAVLVMQASRDFFKVEAPRSIRGMGSARNRLTGLMG